MTLDQILNVAVPVVIILIVVGFIWIKFLSSWCTPLLVKFWEWLKSGGTSSVHVLSGKKEIVYE